MSFFASSIPELTIKYDCAEKKTCTSWSGPLTTLSECLVIVPPGAGPFGADGFCLGDTSRQPVRVPSLPKSHQAEEALFRARDRIRGNTTNQPPAIKHRKD